MSKSKKTSEKSTETSSRDTKQDSYFRIEKLVQNSINAFIQWVPLGGSGGLFLSFLLDQKWFMAILMFPVTVVTTIWASYSENFITRLKEIYAEQGKQDADELVNALRSLNEAITWQFINPEKKYLQCQFMDCTYYETEGFKKSDGIGIPLLQEAFVPLELSTNFTNSPEGNLLPNQMGGSSGKLDPLLDKQSKQGSLSIWDLLRRSRKNITYRRLAILAWGGFGKTTLLRHITYTYAKNRYRRHRVPKLVPVLLYLRKWRDLIVKEPSLPELITKHHIPSLPDGEDLDFPKKWAENLLKRGDALVMLDGFDEVPEEQRPVVSRWIGKQMKRYSRSIFIITSRPGGYKGDKGYTAQDKPSQIVSIKHFTQEQWENFIYKWYICQERHGRNQSNRHPRIIKAIAKEKSQELIEQINKREELKQMSTNPLLLNMIATFHRFYPGDDLPRRRVELYSAICELQLRDRPRSKGIKMFLPFSDSYSILQVIAFSMVKTTKITIDKSLLLSWIYRYLNHIEVKVEPDKFLNQIARVSELLIEREPNQYEFSHFSFQGYLASVYISKFRNPQELLLENHQKDWWKETILLYVGQLKNPNIFLRKLLEKRSADLAYDCMQESPSKIESSLKANLIILNSENQRARFNNLKTYLRDRQWKKADIETYNLITIVTGKEEGEKLIGLDLLNFPCDELQIIDELWKHWSHEKFGFSIQKEIYMNCGGEAKNELPSEKVQREFCYKVGWQRVNGVWLKHHDLSFDITSAPTGHLPASLTISPVNHSPVYSGIWSSSREPGFFVLHRLESCTSVMS